MTVLQLVYESIGAGMSILVGRVTGESFSDIYNGGSERERAAAVDAWRIYLHHLAVDPEIALDGSP